MRLTAIKLAGFKSFVDPTTIKLPSNLLAVVGPNGCGKSNIIDAVRWVMGETSARQLRGESMSDVIFSGSSSRKPVTTATVELIFDNSDGRAGGEFAKYNEISVRRQVSRDGQSAYFLNGSRCRRKDITDLFLGTGLGPRSYAIIEQGMISQIVEARPEDLRGFLEEAAGVSLYKERRRETENRIRHTRENLERLTDLRDEVGKQLAKLKRQAKAAERYRTLKQRYREEEARLTALRWRNARQRSEAQAAKLRETETAVERAVAAQREAEKSLESLREQQHQASEHSSSVQAELYEVAGEIARLEQAIEHQRALLARQKSEFADVESQIGELQQHLVLDRAQVEDVTSRLADLEPALSEARSEEQEAQTRLEQGERELQERQERYQTTQAQGSKLRQQVELLRLRISHADERMNQAAQRLQRLSSDDGEARNKLDEEAASTAAELERLGAELTAAERSLAARQDERSRLREAVESGRAALDEARGRLREVRGRLESLHVLNRPSAAADTRARIERAGLGQAPTLLQSVEVSPRWQHAVETVLARWLEARVIEQELPREALDWSGVGVVSGRAGVPRPATLAAEVQGAGALTALLSQVRCAQDPASAWSALDTIEAHESVITPDGLWLGKGWSWSRGEADEREQGRLARQQEIRSLESEQTELAQVLEHGEAEQRERQQALRTADEAIEADRSVVQRLKSRQAQLQGIRSGQDSRRESLDRQRQAQQREREELAQRQQQDQQALGEARRELEQSLETMEVAGREEAELLEARNAQQIAREGLRQAYRECRDRREEVALKLESSRASLDSLKQAIARMDTQIGQLQGRFVELSQALAQGDRPVRDQQAARDQLLNKRLEVEQRLKQARAALEALEAQWRENDGKRQQAAAEAEQARQRQSEMRVRLREIEIEAEQHARRVAELEADLEALVAELPEEAAAEGWIDELARLEESIQRLEPVNLAAIQEFEQESERKDYLDRQHADLVEALETLEQAIARIDRTTRTRYRDTFERVNANMEVLFPRLFGGGHAHLEMVGDDWLTAGAAILARPPGKRISRIHLLSGGEKALTAVAFVFAIFNLNPAPFCLLDEVDAPLDDANVGRFSELVREMSDKVQFLFVTHNKVTMEVAHQMLGVTMREPGISRLVSVDLDKAVALVAD
jgi:chromosome segregation protein